MTPPADSSRRFAGAIDEPRVYARALSAAEITAAAGAASSTVGATDPALLTRLTSNGGAVNTTTDRTALNPASALSVSAWVNATSWPTQIFQGSIIAKDTWASGNAGYVLRGGAGGKISFLLNIGGALCELQTTATVPTGGWHHVAGTYDMVPR